MSRLRERRRWVVSFPILRPFLTETVPSAQARDRARYARELEEYKEERLAEQEAEVDSDDEPLMKKPAVKEESSSSDDD